MFLSFFIWAERTFLHFKQWSKQIFLGLPIAINFWFFSYFGYGGSFFLFKSRIGFPCSIVVVFFFFATHQFLTDIDRHLTHSLKMKTDLTPSRHTSQVWRWTCSACIWCSPSETICRMSALRGTCRKTAFKGHRLWTGCAYLMSGRRPLEWWARGDIMTSVPTESVNKPH